MKGFLSLMCRNIGCMPSLCFLPHGNKRTVFPNKCGFQRLLFDSPRTGPGVSFLRHMKDCVFSCMPVSNVFFAVHQTLLLDRISPLILHCCLLLRNILSPFSRVFFSLSLHIFFSVMTSPDVASFGLGIISPSFLKKSLKCLRTAALFVAYFCLPLAALTFLVLEYSIMSAISLLISPGFFSKQLLTSCNPKN